MKVVAVHQMSRRCCPWLAGGAPDGEVAVSTRIRLARNLAGIPFPNKATVEQKNGVFERIRAISTAVLAQEQAVGDQITQFDETDRLVLQERRLISRELAHCGAGSGMFVSRDEKRALLVNEEDHVRMQVLLPGLQLDAAWIAADAMDQRLLARVDTSFDPALGFLTACPSNVGTGLRASVMLHLPGLTLGGQMDRVLCGVRSLGLAARGIYGEGSDALGEFYQISNQSTLGESEKEVIERLGGVIRQVVWHEKSARLRLLWDHRDELYDRIGQALGTLKYRYILTVQEAVQELSWLRLGVFLEIVQSIDMASLNELMTFVHPGHLLKRLGSDADRDRADAVRAEMLRNRLRSASR